MAKLKFDGEMRTQWIVFVGVFFMCFSAMGLGSNAFGIFTVPITEALNMPRSTYNTFETVSKIVGMVTAAMFSTIYRKVGPKGSVLIAGGGYVAQYLLFAIADSLPMLLVGGFFAGIGYTFAAQMTVFAVIPPWFKKSAGTMTSILSACNTFGTSVWTYFLIKWLATQGYKQALIYSAIIMAVMCTISALLVKASPDDPLYGKDEDGGKDDKEQTKPLSNRELLRMPIMWMLIAIYFIVAAIGHPFTANIPAFANAKGLPAETGAAAYALCYALMGPAKIVVGVIKDRFGGAKVSVIFVFAFFILACLGVMLPVSGKMYVFMAGVGHGIGGTMSQLLIAFVVLETFGKYYHPGQLGICLVMFNIGRAIGMPAVHLEYDATGHYTITMATMIGLALVVMALSFLSLRGGRAWQKRRDAELKASAQS